ncbi:unnamed protein product [Umbelopsis sp. WA50703]
MDLVFAGDQQKEDGLLDGTAKSFAGEEETDETEAVDWKCAGDKETEDDPLSSTEVEVTEEVEGLGVSQRGGVDLVFAGDQQKEDGLLDGTAKSFAGEEETDETEAVDWKCAGDREKEDGLLDGTAKPFAGEEETEEIEAVDWVCGGGKETEEACCFIVYLLSGTEAETTAGGAEAEGADAEGAD